MSTRDTKVPKQEGVELTPYHGYHFNRNLQGVNYSVICDMEGTACNLVPTFIICNFRPTVLGQVSPD